jgi:hypothetical protein
VSAAPPPGPELARVRRRAFMGFFAVLAALSLVGGYWVVRESRARALQVDAALRVAGWGLLCYAHDERAWPRSAEALEAWAMGRTCCGSAGAAGGTGWPESAPEDCSQMTLQQALATVSLSVDPAGEGPPKLSGGGRPSSLGTLETVNGWISARASAGFVAHSAP